MGLLFYLIIAALSIAARIFYKSLVYVPLLFGGYFVSSHILSKRENGIYWLILTVVFAYLLYLFIFFLKGMMVCLKRRHKCVWIPLFILCVVLTCVMPVWILHNILSCIMTNQTVVWILSGGFGYFVYLKYQFTSDTPPASATPFYQAGVQLVATMLK